VKIFVADEEANLAFAMMGIDKPQLYIPDVSVAFIRKNAEKMLAGIGVHSLDKITAGVQSLLSEPCLQISVDVRII